MYYNYGAKIFKSINQIKYCFRSTFSFKRHISLITIYNIVFNNMDKRKIFKLHKNKCIYSTNNIPYFNCGHSNHEQPSIFRYMS